MDYTKLFGEIMMERERAERLHGKQLELPLGCSSDRKWRADLHREMCEEAKQLGNATWRHILLEEVYEAFAEDDLAKIRTELIQVAATVFGMIEAVDHAKDE